jgi:hypothetical protein
VYGTKSFICPLLFLASAGSLHAEEAPPFIYIATQDPFINAENPARLNDVHVFGGVFGEGAFGDNLQFWDVDYTDNYLVGVAFGRDFRDLGAGFLLGGVAGAAVRFGDDDDTTGEVWAGLRLRHYGLVIGDLAISPAVTVGLSAVSGPTEIERLREISRDGDATLLGFIGPELSFRLKQAPNVELVYQLHHRSGADGLFGDLAEGSNANTIGLRYRF